MNYLCKVNSLYAFETQFEGLVPTFCSRIVIHKGYYKRPLSYRNTCSKWWDCRALPTPEPLTCCATAPFTRCTSVSQPFTGLSCSSPWGWYPAQPWSQIRRWCFCRSDYSELQHVRNKHHIGLYTCSGIGAFAWIFTLLPGEQQCRLLENC